MGGGGVIQQSSAGAAVHIFYLDRLHCTCREFTEQCEKGETRDRGRNVSIEVIKYRETSVKASSTLTHRRRE